MDIDKPKIDDFSVSTHDHKSDSKGGILEVLASNNSNLFWSTPSTEAGLPAFRPITIDNLTGTLAVTKGGTGAITLTGILLGNGVSAFTSLALTAGQSIRMNALGTAYEGYTPPNANSLLPIGSEGSMLYYNTSTSTWALTSITYNNTLTAFNLGSPTINSETVNLKLSSGLVLSKLFQLELNASSYSSNYADIIGGSINKLQFGRNSTKIDIIIGDGSNTTTPYIRFPYYTTPGFLKVDSSGVISALATSGIGTRFLREDGSWQVIIGGGTISGSGTADTVVKWTGSGTVLGNSIITSTQSYVSILTPTQYNSSVLNVNGSLTIIDNLYLHSAGSKIYLFGNAGTSGQVLTSGGSNGVPSWTNANILPTYTPIAAQNLSGSNVFSSIQTDLHGAIIGLSTRTLTLSDLGGVNYGAWYLGINDGTYSSIVSYSGVNFIAGTNITLSRSGNSVTINSSGGGGSNIGNGTTIGQIPYWNGSAWVPSTNGKMIYTNGTPKLSFGVSGSYETYIMGGQSGSSFYGVHLHRSQNNYLYRPDLTGYGHLYLGRNAFTTDIIIGDNTGTLIDNQVNTANAYIRFVNYTAGILRTSSNGLIIADAPLSGNAGKYLSTDGNSLVWVVAPTGGGTPTSHALESHTATTTAGKLLYGTGANTFGWLTLGSALQILRVNSSGTGIEWVTNSTGITNSILTIGAHLSGGSFNGSIGVTIATDATSSNTFNTIISRDSGGNFICTNATFTSDIRLKANVKTLLPQYLDIRYIEYENINSLGEKRYGVSAQELLLIDKELVKGSYDDGYSVKYIDLLIREVAYLKEEVKKLKENA